VTTLAEGDDRAPRLSFERNEWRLGSSSSNKPASKTRRYSVKS